MDVSDLQLRRSYAPEQVGLVVCKSGFFSDDVLMLIVMQAYGNSKAAQIMFGEHLAREVEARGANVKIIR